MKKSKFLKKSLAMLLALMLVIAMIPLSASAASAVPNLTSLYIDDIATSVSGTTFTGEVYTGNGTVKLRVAKDSLGTPDGNGYLYVVKPDKSAKLEVTEAGTEVTLKDWATESSTTWSLTLELVGSDKAGANAKTFTMELTKSSKFTTASLDTSVQEAGTGVYTVAVNNADHIVTIEVPTGVFSAGTNTATFTVKTQDSATIEDGTADTNSLGGGRYTITVGAKDQTFTVKSQSGNNEALYTVKVNEKDGLNSFKLGNYEGKIDPVNHTVTVEVNKEDLYDEHGKLKSALALPVTYETYHLQTTVEIGVDGDKLDDYSTGSIFTVSGISNTTLESNELYNGVVVLSCADIAQVQWYPLYIRIKSSENTAITSAKFDDEAATIDGDKISAVLPVTKADGDETKLNSVAVTLYTSTYEEIKSISNFTKTGTSGANDVWTATLDLTTPKLVTVTAEDGTTEIYTLSASLATDKETARLDTIYLKGNGYESKGNIVGNTITFEVPYMTLDVSNWKIFATPNSSARVIANATALADNATTVTGTAVENGSTGASAMGISKLDVTTTKATGFIAAVNKNDNTVFQVYDVVVKLITPAKMGNTLSNLEISIQNVNPDGQLNSEVYDRVTPYNTIKASETITITQDNKSSDNTGLITFKPAASLSGATNIWNEALYTIVSKIETANGGVPFLVTSGGGTNYSIVASLSGLVDNALPYSGLKTYDMADFATGSYYIMVLPEDTARTVLVRNNGYIYGAGNGGVEDERTTGTLYSIKVVAQNQNPNAVMSNISVKGNALNVVDSFTISGKLPYGVTAKDNSETTKGTFMDFELSPHARVQASYTGGSGYVRPSGDTDDDGIANDVTNNNLKLLFVRSNTDHSVNVYVSSDGTGYDAVLTNNELTVIAENGSKNTYKFDLEWADPNTEAEITSFKIGNSTGRISGDKITVTVPYGTDLTGLVPTFTTSTGATVTLGDEPVVSGKTFMNFTNAVTLNVTSEDGKKVNPYTVTVNVSEAFDDVKPGAWYYDNVMQAAAAGIVSGRGDGTFDPTANVTRRDFAIMLTQMMGISNDGTAVSPFIDVDDDDYGVVAIAYCAAHDIVSGYEDGTFQPDKTITRQEAASMIVKAMGVSTVSNDLYPDDSSIAGWAKDAVYKAKAAGLMKGDAGTGNFRPTSTITRAEAASIMVNALNQ